MYSAETDGGLFMKIKKSICKAAVALLCLCVAAPSPVLASECPVKVLASETPVIVTEPEDPVKVPVTENLVKGADEDVQDRNQVPRGEYENPPYEARFVKVSGYAVKDADDQKPAEKLKMGDRVTMHVYLSDAGFDGDIQKIRVSLENEMFRAGHGQQPNDGQQEGHGQQTGDGQQINGGHQAIRAVVQKTIWKGKPVFEVVFEGVYTRKQSSLIFKWLRDGGVSLGSTADADLVKIDMRECLDELPEDGTQSGGQSGSGQENPDGGSPAEENPSGGGQAEGNTGGDGTAPGSAGDSGSSEEQGISVLQNGSGVSQGGQNEAAKESVTVPVLVVKSAVCSEKGITPGEDFELTVEIEASEGSYPVTQTVAVLGLPRGITFAETDRIYLGTINPGQTVQAVCKLSADKALSAETLSFDMNIEGFIALGNMPVTSECAFSVPVYQTAVLAVEEVYMPENLNTAYDDGSRQGYVVLRNTGGAPAENIRIEISGGGLSIDGGYCEIDVIEAGTSRTADFNILAEKEGSLSGTLTVSFTDASGNEQKLSREIAVKAAYVKADIDQTVLINEALIQEEKTVPAGAWLFIAGIGIVGLTILIKNGKLRHIL